jgi:hypothetical protein
VHIAGSQVSAKKLSRWSVFISDSPFYFSLPFYYSTQIFASLPLLSSPLLDFLLLYILVSLFTMLAIRSLSSPARHGVRAAPRAAATWSISV